MNQPRLNIEALNESSLIKHSSSSNQPAWLLDQGKKKGGVYFSTIGFMRDPPPRASNVELASEQLASSER